MEKGYRRIAIVNPPANLNYTSHRRKGYLKDLREWGIETEKDLVVDMELSFESGLDIMCTFMMMKKPPRAFLSLGVSVSLGMQSALKQAGFSVGSDVGLIAFEGTRYLKLSDSPVSAFHALWDHAGS